MEVVYLDTNIYLDYLLDRVGKTGRRLGKCASGVIWKAIKGEIAIAASDLNMREFDRQLDVGELNTLFSLVGKNLIKVYTTDEDRAEAKKLSEINYDDALHVVLAKKAKSNVIITRNTDHFAPFSSIIKSCPPEEFC